jgi:hypothetical protein
MLLYVLSNNPNIIIGVVSNTIISIRERLNDVAYVEKPYVEEQLSWCFVGNVLSHLHWQLFVEDNILLLSQPMTTAKEMEKSLALQQAFDKGVSWNNPEEYYFSRHYGIPIMLTLHKDYEDRRFYVTQINMKEELGSLPFKAATTTLLKDMIDDISRNLGYGIKEGILTREEQQAWDRYHSFINYKPTLHDKLYDQDIPMPDRRELNNTWWIAAKDLMKHQADHPTRITPDTTRVWDALAQHRAEAVPNAWHQSGAGTLIIHYWAKIGDYYFTLTPHRKSNGLVRSYTLYLEPGSYNGQLCGRLEVFEADGGMLAALNYANEFVQKHS